MTTDVGARPPGPVGPTPRPAVGSRRTPGWWRGVREMLLIVALWLAYSAGRNLARQDRPEAHRRALDLLHAEQFLHIDLEHALNNATNGIAWISLPMCYWYAALHYLVTPLALIFIYVRRREDYSRARNVLVLASLAALVVYIFLPTEPPRLADLGYVDTMAKYASDGWWSAHASAPAGMQGLTNEYAAMPSLHVGWTLWVAWALRPYLGRIGRGLTYCYVFGTSMVVLSTGNHWLLDIIAGLADVAAAIWVVDHVAPLRRDDGFLELGWTAWSRFRRATSRD